VGCAMQIGYPEKFELALRYSEGPLQKEPTLNDSDRLLLYALSSQARFGPCKEPRPSIWDGVAKAKWNAWMEIGNRSKMEAMFMFVTAVEEVRRHRRSLEPTSPAQLACFACAMMTLQLSRSSPHAHTRAHAVRTRLVEVAGAWSA
jgi:acyl-CoA-binding protein